MNTSDFWNSVLEPDETLLWTGRPQPRLHWPALLVLIPARATWRQLRTYEATRYALTDKRVLFFQIEGQKTRAKAIPRSAMTTPERRNTVPPSVIFLRQDPEKKSAVGFDYINDAEVLLPHLEASH